MRRAPLLSLLFAGLLATAPLLGPSDLGVAQAAEAAPLFEGLFVEILPIGDLPGDGVTPVSLHILAVDRMGAPLTGVELKAKASVGALSELQELQPGIFRSTYTPPEVDVTTPLTVEIKGKTLDKQKFSRAWGFTLQPPISQRVSVTVSPTRLVLQEGASASLDIQFVGGSSQYREGARLQLRSSVGSIENLTPLGDGRYSALFKAPPSVGPSVAVITAVDQRDPTRTYGHITLPLTAPKDLPVVSLPGASVMVRIGDQEFGPVPTDKRGKATVPVVVPPGVSGGTLITLKDNARTEAPLDLQVAPARRVELFGHYADLPGDGGLQIPVRVAVVRPDGSPDSGAALDLQAVGGSFGPARHEGNGVYVLPFVPDRAAGVLSTEIAARIAGDPAPPALLPLRLIPVRPARVDLSSDPPALAADTTAFSVNASILDGMGAGLSGRDLSFQVAGARAEGPTADHGDGTYSARFTRTGKGPAELLATVKSQGVSNPVRQVVVLPTVGRLPPNGLSSTALTILAVDEFGYPVANVPVSLSRILGDGELPRKATTDAAGIAQVQYTAGRAPGLVVLRVEAAGRVANLGLLQLPPDISPGLALPFSGTATEAALESSWRPIIQPMRIEKVD